MEHFQRVVLVLGVLAAVGAEPQGNNEYLPPDKGYSYNKPSVPFPSNPQRPSTQYSPPPPPAPQQPYRPPASRPPPSRPAPTYNPPSPTYGTPAPSFNPQVTYRPPSPPAYNPPPTAPAYKPPTPTYGPPQDTYRPPPPPPPQQPNRPAYTPPSGPTGDHSHDHSHSHGADHVHEPGMPYDFNYAVRAEETGAEFSQNEVSDGDQVKGEYRVQLPDGRLQIVRYTADWKTGFHADVTYEGEAKYPDYVPNASRPSGTIADRPSGGYSYPNPGQANPPNSYAPPSTGGPY